MIYLIYTIFIPFIDQTGRLEPILGLIILIMLFVTEGLP